MTKSLISPRGGAAPLGAYSHGWRAGDLLFVTGTGPIDVDGQVEGSTVAEQTNKVIDNIVIVLREAGLALTDVVKVTTYLADTATFPEYDREYRRRFTEPFPTRTTLGVDLGQVPGMLVEIECIAYYGSTHGEEKPA